MICLLRLEEKGYSSTKMAKQLESFSQSLNLPSVVGGAKWYTWVAEIVDWGPCRFERVFLKAQWDFYHANSTMSRGVYRIFELESGKVYEVKDNKRRYFCTVDENGELQTMTLDEVDEWIGMMHRE